MPTDLFQNPQEIFNAASTLAAVLSTFTAICSAYCAFASFKLAEKIKLESESDERIFTSKVIQPNLLVPEHRWAVLYFEIFNKSKRKVTIEAIDGFDLNGKLVKVNWSCNSDELGNLIRPVNFLGVTDSASIYVRKADGSEINFLRLRIQHSFSDKPHWTGYDPVAEMD